jgi:ribose-phosphate pyrophosphokinase
LKKYIDHKPILVDDIISTARTMIETVGHLKNAGMKQPVCIGIHPVMPPELMISYRRQG